MALISRVGLTTKFAPALVTEMTESNGAFRRRGGRLRSEPIGLLPPGLVAMTSTQREAAIESLAVLLGSWLCEHTHGHKRGCASGRFGRRSAPTATRSRESARLQPEIRLARPAAVLLRNPLVDPGEVGLGQQRGPGRRQTRPPPSAASHQMTAWLGYGQAACPAPTVDWLGSIRPGDGIPAPVSRPSGFLRS